MAGTVEKTRAVGYLLGAKVVADMFPAFALLDYFILGVSIVLVIAYAKSGLRLKVSLIDGCSIFMLTLIALNAVEDTAGVTIAIKIASAYLMYFLGRLCWRSFDFLLRCLWYSVCAVVLINFTLLIAGSGFQVWGASHTFSGMYYFKTDLASAMCCAVIVAIFGRMGSLRARLVITTMAVLLLILSNSRMYYIILVVLVAMMIASYRGMRFGLGFLVAIALALVAAIFILRFLGESTLFRQMGFISFQFDSLEDLFNDANTQGRNVVFAEQLKLVLESPIENQLFGNGFSGGNVLVNGVYYGQHSLYVGMLYNLGWIGMLVSLAMVAAGLFMAGRIEDEKTSYCIVAFLLTYLLAGISVDVAQYTATSWIPLSLVGCSVSFWKEKPTKQCWVIPLVNIKKHHEHGKIVKRSTPVIMENNKYISVGSTKMQQDFTNETNGCSSTLVNPL